MPREVEVRKVPSDPPPQAVFWPVGRKTYAIETVETRLPYMPAWSSQLLSLVTAPPHGTIYVLLGIEIILRCCCGIKAGRWPLQTRSEDAKAGLEPQLAELVTTARYWLTTRGLLTTDGPLTGFGGGYSGGGGATYGGDSVGIGWKKTVVVRTHAAMCASALLEPGWGPGHQIMGAMEQVLCPRRGCMFKE